MSGSSSSKLPFPPTVAQLYARALWDPKPTTSLKSQKQLAYALGYPLDWRVERTVEVTEDGKKSILRDRIHATGKKNKSQYTWFHHEAAQLAAAQLEEEGVTTLDGSHLLPPTPLYTKGDLIQVQYEGKWWASTITKRQKRADNFLYSVHYHEENATQDEVAEEDIRPGEDPSQLAVEIGFPEDWKASRKGARYILTAPSGERFTTKKAALKYLKELTAPPEADEDDDMGDPPWRTEGHELIGRQILWSTLHRISGTRKIKVDQVGTVDGYIDAADVDSQGNPGFVSDATGTPANLFHVSFPDDTHHPYASHLINSQDLEEHEILENLMEESASAKRKRLSLGEGSASKKKRGRR
jgi:hypothetical protein